MTTFQGVCDSCHQVFDLDDLVPAEIPWDDATEYYCSDFAEELGVEHDRVDVEKHFDEEYGKYIPVHFKWEPQEA